MPIDDRTTNRSYKLPNAGNLLSEDVQRLRDALTAIDADVFARYTKTETDQKLADLINGAPGALDTLNELAAAMGNDPNFATTITNALAGKPGFADVWTRTQADARYVQGITQTENVFTGTGSQATFTLTQTPPTRESLLVTVDGVVQPTTAYNLSGSALILSEAPASGASIRVLMLGVAGPVQSASTLNFTQAGTGAVTRTVDSKLKDAVSVKDFGASSAASAAANLAAFKSAVAATAAGGRLVIPVDSSFYSIDATGGLSAAIEINKRMEIVLEGDAKSNFGTMQANPPYIFNITADGVTISGNGKLIGNGTIDDTNSGTISTFPGLVRVAANNFTMTGVTVEAPPKVGVALVNCESAKIQNVTFTGGPAAYTIGNTAHFAIYAFEGGYHTILGNHFVPSNSGGIFTNCIFFNAANRCRVSDNSAKFAWEKLAYLNGNYNIVANNTYVAPVAGNYTDAYRMHGSHNKLIGNTSIGAMGGCQVFDGVGNEVISNNFIDCTQAGIFVGHSGGAYSGGFNQTKIIGNTVTGGTGTKTDGIRFSVDGASTSGVIISGNVVSSMTATNTEGLIRVSAVSPHSIDDALVANNRLLSGTNGIYLNRVIRSLVSGNLISGATNYAMVESGGAYNKFSNNKGRSISVIGINALSATSYGEGNQYTDANLTGTVTLSAAVITTVTHGGVAPNARVFLQEANTQAGVMVVSKGSPLSGVSGQNFAITMANGTAAAGTEQYYYQIIQ
jgi:hypothetical protein